MKKCIVLLLALFLLTGCAAQEKTAALTASCQEIAEKVMAAAGFQELTAINEKYLEKHFLIRADDLEDWALYRDATRATPEMVLIAKVKSDADQAAVKKALNAYNSEQLTLYRDPDQAVTASLRVTVPKSEQQSKVRITVQAENSNTVIETRSYTLEPEDSRVIEDSVEIPDSRTYTYTVYNGDTQIEQKVLNAE